MNLPLVSILIPVFNRENIIEQTLESALVQTYPNTEIIVVDNCSSDATWAIIKKYSDIHSNIKAYQNLENIGPVRNWLACLEKASGEFVKILWSDDLLDPECVQQLLLPFDDPDVGFSYSSVVVFSGDDRFSGVKSFNSVPTGIYPTSQFINGTLMGEDYPVSPGCALFRTIDVRKNLLLNVPNSIDSDFSMHAIGNDLLLFLLTASQYKKFFVNNRLLSFFRSHSGSITISSSSGKIPLHYDLAKGYFLENYSVNRSIFDKTVAMFYFDLHRYDAAIFKIKNINSFFPTLANVKLSIIAVVFVAFGKIFRTVKRKLLRLFK